MSSQSQQTQQQSSNSTTNANGAVNPWSVQVPYLSNAFSQASNTLPTAQQYTPDQLALYSSMLGSYQNPTLNGTVTSSANAGAGLSGAGAGGAAEGLFGLANFNPSATNNTANVVGGANSIVAGANLPGQVSAAMVPAEQAAEYGLSPQIDRTAAGEGDSNSSRDAIEHGLLASNLAQQANGLYGSLYGSTFNSGVNTTENLLSGNNANSLSALLGLTTGGTGAANAGTAANAGAVANQGGVFNLASSGATGQNNDPFQALQNYYNIVGANNWGNTSSSTANTTGTQTGTTTYDPSQMSTIGAWTNLIGSLV